MQGVVTVLDEQHYRLVESLWDEFGRRFGIADLYRTPIPHISYHVAEQYDLTLLEGALHRVAENVRAFEVRTTGLGIFTGAQPVLYIPVARSRMLDEFQRMLWERTARYGVGVSPHYAPEHWMPHITLADGNINPSKLGELVRFLSVREFAWEIPMDNLCLISSGAEVFVRIELGF